MTQSFSAGVFRCSLPTWRGFRRVRFVGRLWWGVLRVESHESLVARGIEQHLLFRKGRDTRTYLDAEGNKHSELGPSVSDGSTSLKLYTVPEIGSPSFSFRATKAFKARIPVWRLIFQNFPEDMDESTVDAIVEHVFCWSGQPIRAKIGRPSQVLDAAIKDALPADSREFTVLWKHWQAGQKLSDKPLPQLISQHEAHGGVWTIVDGAGDLPAEADHPLVQVCADATRIVGAGAPESGLGVGSQQ